MLAGVIAYSENRYSPNSGSTITVKNTKKSTERRIKKLNIT